MLTGRKFQKLARRYLLGEMPGFAVDRGLLFASPIGFILRAYSVQPSAFSKADFCIQAFVQPLFIPDGSIVFDLGDRLGSIRGRQEKWWTHADEHEDQIMADVLRHIRREGPVILDKFMTLGDFLKNVYRVYTNRLSPYQPEMLAYAAVLLGAAGEAAKWFNRLEQLLRNVKDRHDYHDELLMRARRVRTTFERDREEAAAILKDWRLQTAANLRLTKYLARVE